MGVDSFAASHVDGDDRYRLLVEAITDYAIYMLDSTGRVSSWNPGAQRFKGYRPAEIIGQHFSRFYTEEDRAAGVPETALRTAAEAGRYEAEGWRVRKDGERFWAHVLIDPIRSPAGQLIGFAKVTRDLTERKQAEETLRQAQRSLDQTRQALFQSQKLDAIGQLTGGVAHDFNNLLMAVLASLELLRKRLPQDPKALALLENAVMGAERGAALTQRMLAFARKQELQLEGVDIPALVQGVSGLLQRSLGPSIQLVTRFPSPLSPAFTDANQLETALLNLAVNARDAMPDGGRITIEATGEQVGPTAPFGLPEGDYVCLTVVDTGPGMDEQTLARAAEPFFTTKGVGKGTGLGLSMVHGLAEQSGGRLRLVSRPGEGLRVEIWLPRADAVGARAPASPDELELTPARPLVVLAVDDDALVLMNTEAMLEDLGHEVLTAMSGSEALEILAKHRVDVVVTDQAMPRMTGLQLAQELETRLPGVPVILATGYAELPVGGGDLPRLAKPYHQADLARILRRIVAGQRR